MSYFLRLICFSLIIFFVFGCAPLYQPSSIHVPELKEKGDLSVQGSYKLSNDVNVNAAYALTDQTSVMVNTGYMYFDGPYEGYHNHITEESYSIEIGYGRYEYNSESYSNYFGGVGTGYHFAEGTRMYEDTLQFAKGNFVKAFYQYGVGFDTMYKIHIAFMARLNYVYTYNYTTDATDDETGFENFWAGDNQQHILSLEPGIEIRVDILPHTELFIQHAIAVDLLSEVEEYLTEDAKRDFSSVGVKIKISEMF